MAVYLRLTGDALPALTPLRAAPAEATPDAKLVGNLPGLTYWFDPDPAFIPLDANGKRVWRDRRSGARFRTAGSGVNVIPPTLSTAINGKPTISTVGTTLMTSEFPEDFNATAWSAFIIAKADTTGSRFLIGQSVNNATAGQYGPNLAMTAGAGGTAGTPRIYDAPGNQLLSAVNVVPPGDAALLGYHYSAARGLTITKNGTQVANVASANDLTLTQFQLFQTRLTTSTAWSGAVGDMLIFSIDTTATGNETTHATVGSVLLTKYGL